MSAVPEGRTTATLTGLSFLWLEITGQCNLTCSHCYADSGPNGAVRGEMRHQDWYRVIDEAASLGCREIQFIGGEPTLHPDLEDLITIAGARGFTFVEVFTNAMRLCDSLIRCFRENNVAVASSFYSYDPDAHGLITGSRSSWQRTVDGFRKVLQAGLTLRVGVIEMEANAGHLERTKRFLSDLGVHSAKFDRQRGVGRGRLQQIKRSGSEFDELCGQCWKGRLCVTHSGIAYPCVFAREFPMGDVRQGLREVISSARLVQFRASLCAARQSMSVRDEDSPPEWCSPNCAPVNDDCGPTFCVPDGAGCTPNDPDPD